WMRYHGSRQSIGPDKLSQLRHVRFFRDMDGVRAHMQKHAAILRPKFDTVLRVLAEELGAPAAEGTGDASGGGGAVGARVHGPRSGGTVIESSWAQWTRPRGGYFISLDTQDGLAKRVGE